MLVHLFESFRLEHHNGKFAVGCSVPERYAYVAQSCFLLGVGVSEGCLCVCVCVWGGGGGRGGESCVMFVRVKELCFRV